MARAKGTAHARGRIALDRDRAVIALFIAAMDANGHVARDELARAQHLIWSARRFRNRSGDEVGMLIDETRTMLEEHGTGAVLDAAARAIPARVRPSAFALLCDLLLADGKIDAKERRFLDAIATKLAIDRSLVRQLIETMLLKNRL
jgi:uncharacterized tellurite resistance protein B-like protein